MHNECYQFLARVKRARPRHFGHVRVLEIGSRDLNGTPRDFFHHCRYLGCDLEYGPGVDLVMAGERLAYPAGSFDVVVSTEVLEHTPHWAALLQNAWRMLAPGGIVIVTAAATGRAPHCTPPGGHYRNLDPAALRPRLPGLLLWEEDYAACDLRFCLEKR